MRFKTHFFLILILFLALIFRINLFSQVGKDSITYKRALREFVSGQNPYEYTIHTFEKEKQDWDHGYSYFPAMLYVIYPFYVYGEVNKVDPAIIWKIPVLIADLYIGYLIFETLKSKHFVFRLLMASLWLFNPYLLLNQNYTYLDPLPILFMLLSIKYLENDDVLAGTFFTLAILLKTFPLILLPMFLIKAKSKYKFILSSVIITLVVLLPFMSSYDRFMNMMLGAFFVHGERVVQGKPFLYFLSYITKIELIRIIPTSIYAFLSIFLGLLTTLILSIKKNTNKYLITTLSFATFYLLTPVLNRTYLLWFFPIVLITFFEVLKPKKALISSLTFYGFYFWYLYIWIDGFHITPPY